MEEPELRIMHAVFDVYLPWSMAFLHRLLEALDGRVEQSVVTRIRRNEERFPGPPVERVDPAALIRPRAAVAAAERLRNRRDPRVLHAHMGYSALRSAMLAQVLGVPLVVTFGGADLDDRTDEPAIREFYGYLFRCADRLVTVSDDLRERVLNLGGPEDRVVTVHRGVDPDVFSPAERRGHKGPVRLLMAGRLVEKKGHAVLIDALARLAPEAPQWELTVLGEGPLRRPLEAASRKAGLGDCIEFRPPVASHVLRTLMHEADVLVHPSLTTARGDREGVPNVIYEAQATGLPVLATRHGGIPEVVQDGRTGLLVPEGDAQALAQGVERLLSDAELRLRLGEGGARRMRTEFTLQDQARRYERIYREVLDCAPHRRVTPEPVPAILRAARSSWWRWAEPSVGDLLPGRLLNGALGVARRVLPGWWRKRIKRAALRVAPGVFRSAGRRHAREDDTRWSELAGERAPCAPE